MAALALGALIVTILLILALVFVQMIKRQKGIKREQRRIDFTALLWAALLLDLGLVAVAFTTLFLELDSELLLVSVLLVPLVAFLIVSGKISSIRGPGGWEAKISRVYQEPVEPLAVNKEILGIRKEHVARLIDRLQELEIWNKPIILTLTLEETRYEYWALSEYLERLKQYPGFRFLAVLDSDERLVGYLHHMNLLGRYGEQQIEIFLDGVRRGDIPQLRSMKGFIDQRLTLETTNMEALRIMEAMDIDALLVVNEAGKLLGVAERERIVVRLLIAFVNR